MNARPTVLNVDDDETARTSLTWILQHEGFRVREASTGRDALRLAADRPDLVVLDVVLPDQSGYEVCRRLKADPVTAHTPVLMLSGLAVGSGDRVAGLEGGADAYLTKPADPDVLVAQLRALLRVRRAEEAGRRAVAVLETATDCLVVLAPDWRYVYANPSAERALRHPRDELLGKTIWEVFPEANDSASGRAFRRAVGERVPVEVEDYYPSLGAWFDVRASPTEDGLALCFRDVTARRRAEEEIRLRDRAMRAVSQGILITDPARFDNPVVYANPGFERLTGYTAAEVIGRNCRFLQGKDTDPEAVALLRRAIDGGRACEVEILNFRKDGSPFWNQLSVTPVQDGEGRVTHFVGILADVTARRRLEDQLRQAQKMEAVGQLAGGVAHDFNNLLTVITGYADIAADSLPPDHPARDLVAEMRRAGERAAGLTRQLLAFSRRAILSPRVLDPNALVRDVERMLRRLIGEDVDLAVRLQPGVGRVRVDPGHLEQVLLNLAVNARDAMPTGGQLTIETRDVDLDEEDAGAHTGVRPGRYVLFAVGDTGAGIPPDVLPHIFEPFFTTKGPGKGTGLGRATAHGIVQQADGHLGVYSEVGVGTTFKVYLPRTEDRAAPGVGQSGVRALARGTETVLLAEDEEGVRALARFVLRQAGYEVLEAADGVAAGRVAAAYPGPIHVLVTDVVMPGLGGRDLAAQLVASRPGLKVLYLSGYTDDAVVRHGVLEDHVHFLQKPFSPAVLTGKVREVLDAPDGPLRTVPGPYSCTSSSAPRPP
ncbi:MAG: domain S-box protein [Gemmataceae bacterium]|nr:domain S-box protein [Gemmataceae bacterium]